MPASASPGMLDPDGEHRFEATARAQLALARAHVAVENGGGYDNFISPFCDSPGGSGRRHRGGRGPAGPSRRRRAPYDSSNEPVRTAWRGHVLAKRIADGLHLHVEAALQRRATDGPAQVHPVPQPREGST